MELYSLTYVVLAAGRSARMGFDKVIQPLAGRSPLERVVAALGTRNVVLVVPTRLVHRAVRIAPNARIVVNDEPERGMSHSLRLALELIGQDAHFGVVPADLVGMTQATLARTEALLHEGIDVAYPLDGNGVAGHPVLFSPGMRRVVEELPDGDTLRMARDSNCKRATWICPDTSAFLDIDDPVAWKAFADA
ncbi:MAG: nucleotidyltransferase family protein [Vulcanimicrobiaceae bacterium]